MKNDVDVKVYYAKSKKIDGTQILNKEHCEKVAKLAEKYGKVFACRDEARVAGYMHDFGKYSDRFQGVLNGTHKYIDHAICGAAFLNYIIRNKDWKPYIPIIEAINGHHDGLVSFGELKTYLEESIMSDNPVVFNNNKTAALAGKWEYRQAQIAFRRDFPYFKIPILQEEKTKNKNNIDEMLDTRMLFSCLVDADYTISSEHDLKKPSTFAPQKWLDNLYEYKKQIQKKSEAAVGVNDIRNQIFRECGEAAEKNSGIFTLTAPTGTGKTLALLHFSLRHAVAKKKKKIIVVLPFLTLIEQSTNIYKAIIPEILEDHSQNNLDDIQRELAERWDSPFIITTSVKFFESLFKQKPTDCRKLHNLVDSIIIFDEAQSLPTDIVDSTLKAVKHLCDRYGCTMVFSTATQPNFRFLKGIEWEPTEIISDYLQIYKKMKRTYVEWRINEKTSLENIADEMIKCTKVCVIVNLRKHARKLYHILKSKTKEEIFLLSTDLCPSHRSNVIKKIRVNIKNNVPCRVVSTQCIEAGVDLDFSVMYRALAPLEAIIQAAGRCNRNGLGEGRITIFEPDENGNLYPDKFYQNAAMIVKEMLSEKLIDIDDPKYISMYYEKLFSPQYTKERKELKKYVEQKNYLGVSQTYHLIENCGYKVIVPYEEQRELYEKIRKEAIENGITAKLLKMAAPIIVNTFDKNFEQYCEPLYYWDKKNREQTKSDIFILHRQYENMYLKDLGLRFDVKEKKNNIDKYIL